jgi:Type III restriction enzyme, res subunit/Helicase C-terminal domain
MVKFRLSEPEESIPESIVLMFRDLNRHPSIKFLYSHQDKILEQYYSKHIKNKDVAIELPTGAGKTLVGLLIAEYRRRVFKEKVVFLCPTKQLCFQVAECASRYGINTSVFVGSQSLYNLADFLKYQQGKSIAITTYSGIFNTNPRIEDPDSIICDDAHAADNYVASLWTLSIDTVKHNDLYRSLYTKIKDCIPDEIRFAIDFGGIKHNSTCIDLIPNISLHLNDKFKEIAEVVEAFLDKYKDIKYPWSKIASNLPSCLFYITPEKIEIRPFIPPTQNHAPFFNAKQHVYMSATFGEDGDIERLFGVKDISKIPIPEEWNKRNTGRRLILFPDLSDASHNNTESLDAALAMISDVKRALVITTDDRAIKLWEDRLPKTHTIIKSEKIEKSMDEFTESQIPSILLLATRYDGIDLPGDQCRLMLIDGKPSGSGLQEKYFITRLGASAQLKNRIRTRITQAMGRCTRDESDYSVVIIYGNELSQWLCNADNTKEMHPELQAEIAFGLENSDELLTQDFIDITRIFLSHSNEWQAPENDIRKRRSKCEKVTGLVNNLLASSMKHEINYTYNSWKSRHEDAFMDALKVLSALEGGSEIQPYRAFWQYQAANSAFLVWKNSEDTSFKNSAVNHLRFASTTSTHITWLGKLISKISSSDTQENDCSPLHDCFIEINKLLSKWNIQGSKYDREVAKVLSNIECQEADKFENGLQILGKMLGAQTHRWDKDEQGTPDGLWIFGSWCAFVFEAKTNENPDRAISLDTLRQANTHEARARADKLLSEFIPCITVVISPKVIIREEARKIETAQKVFYISHKEIIKISRECAEALGQVRSLVANNSQEVVTCKILDEYSSRNVSTESIKQRLTSVRLQDMPTK